MAAVPIQIDRNVLKQIKHLIELQKYWQISYGDSDKENIKNDMVQEYEYRGG